MKNTIRGFWGILFMLVIPILGLIIPLMIALGYYIDSNIIAAIIATTIIFIFNKSVLAIIAIFGAGIIVPAIYGDFDLMLVSIITLVVYLIRPIIMIFISKEKED